MDSLCDYLSRTPYSRSKGIRFNLEELNGGEFFEVPNLDVTTDVSDTLDAWGNPFDTYDGSEPWDDTKTRDNTTLELHRPPQLSEENNEKEWERRVKNKKTKTRRKPHKISDTTQEQLEEAFGNLSHKKLWKKRKAEEPDTTPDQLEAAFSNLSGQTQPNTGRNPGQNPSRKMLEDRDQKTTKMRATGT